MPLESRPYDAARFLHDEADCDAYLEAAVEDGDPAVIALVEAAIARWRARASADVTTLPDLQTLMARAQALTAGVEVDFDEPLS